MSLNGNLYACKQSMMKKKERLNNCNKTNYDNNEHKNVRVTKKNKDDSLAYALVLIGCAWLPRPLTGGELKGVD